MSKKRRLRLPTYALTLILCGLTLAAALLGCGAMYLYTMGAYGHTSNGYLQSAAVSRAVDQASSEVYEEFTAAYWRGDTSYSAFGELLEKYRPDNSNLVFILYNENDYVLLSNYERWSGEALVKQQYLEPDAFHVINTQLKRAPDDEDSYLYIRMYVREPLTCSYDAIWQARTQFNGLVGIRWFLLIGIAVCFIAFVVVCILWGRRVMDEPEKNSTLHAVLRRLPMDVCLLLLPLLGLLALVLGVLTLEREGLRSAGNIAMACFICLLFVLACLGCLYALLVQRKNGVALHNTLVARVLRVVRAIDDRLPAVLLYSALILAYLLFGLVLFFIIMDSWWFYPFGWLFGILFLALNGACVAVAVYNTIHAKKMAAASRQVASGDYHIEIDKKHLYGAFRELAENLEQVGGGLQTAVARQMKSERMKTELITNVSHDIKTPLTSIVNYVDLLERLDLDDPQAAEYLEVLGRQSLRLKKLAEDVVEASRAASGDLAVALAPVDVAELLRQALGEYEQRYQAKNLTPVVHAEDARVLADGNLLWRVLDNLLGNAEKYALPGTRVYIDVENPEEPGGPVRLTLRNISASPLNISADELMERFVRGDEARTETGSGLGLSISRSLTEIQGGRFELTVDGDLFKVSLWLPGAPTEL